MASLLCKLGLPELFSNIFPPGGVLEVDGDKAYFAWRAIGS